MSSRVLIMVVLLLALVGVIAALVISQQASDSAPASAASQSPAEPGPRTPNQTGASSSSLGQGTVSGVVDAGAAGAGRNGQPAYAVSGLATPPPFDLAAYRADPDAYCRQVVPGRALQAAQPGPDVPQLVAIGDEFFEIPHQGSVDLTVRTAPDAPVTFYATDLAQFENGYIAMTVRADVQGLATARYTALPGTIGDAHVTAASPLASGRVIFNIEVAPPPGYLPVIESDAEQESQP